MRLLAAVLLFLLPLAGAPSHAQTYPERAITIVVPFPAGSATDSVMRPLALELQAALKVPVIVDNRPGAQGQLAASFVAHAKPDGYTLLAINSSTHGANPSLFKKLSYDPERDFESVAGVASNPQVLMVRADLPASTVAEFVAYANSPNVKLSGGYGSASAQVFLAMFNANARTQVQPIAYRGAPQALTDLMGGTVDIAVVDLGNGLEAATGGRVRPLVMSGQGRSALAPNLPALAETYPGAHLDSWIALAAPAATPPSIVQLLNGTVIPILATDAMKEKLLLLGKDPMPLSSQQLQSMVASEITRWRELVRLSGIEPQ